MKSKEQQEKEYQEQRVKEILEHGFRTSLERYASAEEVTRLRMTIEDLRFEISKNTAEINKINLRSPVVRFKEAMRGLLEQLTKAL